MCSGVRMMSGNAGVWRLAMLLTYGSVMRLKFKV